MLSRDSEDKMWSRFVIWPQEVTLARWTQPSGPLCLWQCFNYGGGFALQASGVALPWGAVFNRLCCSATDDHYGIPHFTCHWNASPVYMFVSSFKHQMNSIVVFVPKLNFNSCNSCWCSSYFKQNNQKWSSSMFFGVKLRINWFDKLLIITSQPTRGWLIRPK